MSTKSKYRFGVDCESEVVSILSGYNFFRGLELVPGSGKYPHRKEDLIGDFVLVQVKSTESNFYSMSIKDYMKLDNNAFEAGKIPVFLVFFTKYNIIRLIISKGDRHNWEPFESNIDRRFDLPITLSTLRSGKAKEVKTLKLGPKYELEDLYIKDSFFTGSKFKLFRVYPPWCFI